MLAALKEDDQLQVPGNINNALLFLLLHLLWPQLPGALFDLLAAKGLSFYLAPAANQPSSIRCIKYMASVMLEASFTNR
jgi:hypothetical protein